MAYNGRLYHDSLPIRTTTDAPLDILSPLAWTGPPLVVPNPANADNLWTPSTIFPPTHPPDDPIDWTPRHVDIFPSIEEGRVVHALRTNSSGDRGGVSIPSVTTPHTYDSNDDDFVANDDVPEPEAWPTAEFKEGPAVGPTTEFKEGPLLPLYLLIPTGTRTVPSKKLMPTLHP